MKAKTATLTADTVETITLNAPSGQPFREVRVITDGLYAVSYRLDGVDPTVDGDDCGYLPDAPAVVVPTGWPAASSTVTVKLISSGTPTVAVEAA